MNEKTFRVSEVHRLEDPERLLWLPPGEVVARLSLTLGMTIADIGAGTGFFAVPFARQIGPAGQVFAVDLQREILDILQAKLAATEMPSNIELRQGTATATGLADNIADLVFLANVWHELEDHSAVLKEAARISRPRGRIAILDWRTDVGRPPGPPIDHRIALQQVERTLSDAGWHCLTSGPVGQFSYLATATLDGTAG
jgi:ubiquinone/menaquinone biosynthesis C-methylase UbiE